VIPDFIADIGDVGEGSASAGRDEKHRAQVSLNFASAHGTFSPEVIAAE
jgi:hypothetical protein